MMMALAPYIIIFGGVWYEAGFVWSLVALMVTLVLAPNP